MHCVVNIDNREAYASERPRVHVPHDNDVVQSCRRKAVRRRVPLVIISGGRSGAFDVETVVGGIYPEIEVAVRGTLIPYMGVGVRVGVIIK